MMAMSSGGMNSSIFYRLMKSKDSDHYEFKPLDRASRLILDYPSSLQNWKPNFFFPFWKLLGARPW